MLREDWVRVGGCGRGDHLEIVDVLNLRVL